MIEMTEVKRKEILLRNRRELLTKLFLIAIRVASKWYNDHLKAYGSGDIEILLLTDDRGNREKATATGIKSSSGNVAMNHMTT